MSSVRMTPDGLPAGFPRERMKAFREKRNPNFKRSKRK